MDCVAIFGEGEARRVRTGDARIDRRGLSAARRLDDDAGLARAAGRSRRHAGIHARGDDAGIARGQRTRGGAGATQLQLPPGFSTDTSADSVTTVGSASQANQFFFGPNGPGDFAGRFGGDGFGNGGGDGPGGQGPGAQDGGRGGAGGRGAPGGRGGAGGRGGPGFQGGGGRGFGAGPFRGRGNQIRGQAFQSFDTSSLDAAPYALNGHATTKAAYLIQRFGANLGGPLVIPKVIDSPRTFFFLNYTGNHSNNPYDAYSTVPSAAERAGDLTAIGGGIIPASQISPAAQNLLALMPLPNQPGATQNFHDVTTVTSHLDDVNVRITRTFGAAAGRGGGGGGRGGGAGGGRGGGGRGGQPGVSNLNV